MYLIFQCFVSSPQNPETETVLSSILFYPSPFFLCELHFNSLTKGFLPSWQKRQASKQVVGAQQYQADRVVTIPPAKGTTLATGFEEQGLHAPFWICKLWRSPERVSAHGKRSDWTAVSQKHLVSYETTLLAFDWADSEIWKETGTHFGMSCNARIRSVGSRTSLQEFQLLQSSA